MTAIYKENIYSFMDEIEHLSKVYILVTIEKLEYVGNNYYFIASAFNKENNVVMVIVFLGTDYEYLPSFQNMENDLKSRLNSKYTILPGIIYDEPVISTEFKQLRFVSMPSKINTNDNDKRKL